MPDRVGKPPREVRVVLGLLDCAASLATHSIELRLSERRVVASLAMGVAGWDIEVPARVVTLPIPVAVGPDRAILSGADGRLTERKDSTEGWVSSSPDE